MKAIVHEKYGPPGVLQVKEIEKPVPSDDDVLVRVRAAGVDPGVWHLITGIPMVIRLGSGLRAPRSRVPGGDVAGVVEQVGASVSQFKTGDEVFGTCEGSFAEFAKGKANLLARKPANVTFEQAAAVPTSATTALRALRNAGEIQAGQKVLIVGAGGGVGTYAVQLAKMFGAEVTGVCSTSKADLVRSIGADHVIDYAREDFAAGTKRYDLIIDLAGRRSLSHLRRALREHGTLVIVGGEGGGRWFAGVDRMLTVAVVSRFVTQRLRTPIAVANREDLEFLRQLLEAETITPVISRRYPLSEAAEAVRLIEQGHSAGKIVLSI